MAVYYCKGGCDRMISVSMVPGGNPVALADPEHWAIDYVSCDGCGAMWCDRCALAQGAACTCGAGLKIDDLVEKRKKQTVSVHALALLVEEMKRPAHAVMAPSGGGPSTGGPSLLFAPPQPPFERAMLLVTKKDFGGAEQLLRGVVEKDARHVDAQLILGLVLTITGRHAEARPCYGAALAAAPADWPRRRDVERLGE